ncbi:MAG: cytochrome c3 family protein [Pirellulales bacterium]|nr:cytochrome c3 family protein [Pirellulales bacterium]
MKTHRTLLRLFVERLPRHAGRSLAIAAVCAVLLSCRGGSSPETKVGYAPAQPVAFSHAAHVGGMGMDCRQCHATVETAARAGIPPTSVCVDCHGGMGMDLPSLAPVRQSADTGKAIRWVRVHDLPEDVFFDHGAHVARGVSCVSCHGRVDQMERIAQVETLSMAWCLDCHRDPAPRLRPRQFVTQLGWDPAQDPTIDEKDRRALGERLMREGDIRPSTDCSTCHP